MAEEEDEYEYEEEKEEEEEDGDGVCEPEDLYEQEKEIEKNWPKSNKIICSSKNSAKISQSSFQRGLSFIPSINSRSDVLRIETIYLGSMKLEAL
ncbi:MAG: hypothetical protein EZS28_023736 [Streblomastix strix]|uniref:Uncharacterized protein n=1 Tax=Streblomastix strix TaxID=222440 RepID=A0A5J4VE73_9EUKA|nr:MAG: hypothetical protein EZS28_023736 [Streblomastix strix]